MIKAIFFDLDGTLYSHKYKRVPQSTINALDILKKKGLVSNNQLQQIEGIWIYPWEFFCPQSFYTNKIHITDQSVSIHMYTDSWTSPVGKIKKKIIRFLGPDITKKMVFVKKLLKSNY